MITNADHQGHDAGGRFAYRPLLQMDETDFDPCSVFWQRRAETVLQELCRRLGLIKYQQWVETVLSDSDTWKDIHDKAKNSLAGITSSI